jgi:hypothetical protein
MAKNESKITPKIKADFEAFSGSFWAWAATQDEDDQFCIKSTIEAVGSVLKVFPKARILNFQGGKRNG